MVQFHPSYDYTDFVEGLRPFQKDGETNIGFELKRGSFKDFCAQALENLIDSQKSTQDINKDAIFKSAYYDMIDKIRNEEIKEIPLKSESMSMEIVDVSDNNNLILKAKDSETGKTYTVSYARLKKLSVVYESMEALDSISNIDKAVRDAIKGCHTSAYWATLYFLLKTVLSECGFFHPQNRSGKGCIYLFDKSNVDIDFVMSRCKRYPDYFKENCILDAKYKHLDNNRIDRNDMHQIISYMHVEKAGIGGFIFPTSQEDVTITKLGNLRGYGGWIYNIGVPIPKEEGTFAMFVAAMTNVLQELKEKILTLC